jgi:hypothetical protein
MTKRRPLFTLEMEVDEMQTEKIQIFSMQEIKRKVSQFFKSYTINDPVFKKKVMQRVNSFVEQLEEKKMFSNPLKSSDLHLKSNEKSKCVLTLY